MSMMDLMVDELKKEGLEIAEESVRMICKAMFRVIPKVVMASENKLDDMVVVVLPILEPMVMDLIDNINKADNV